MLGQISLDAGLYKAKLRELKANGLVRYVFDPKRGPPRRDSVPIHLPPLLELPRFAHADDESGVGMGNGIDELAGMEKNGYRRVLGPENRHTYEPSDPAYQLTRREAAELMIDYLQLPNLKETRGAGNLEIPRKKYDDIRTTGPRGLISRHRTLRRAYLRELASGNFNPAEPRSPVIIKDDMRFKARRITRSTEDAVIVFVLDSSGSTNKVLEYLQEVAWWADTLIRSFYTNVKCRYVHYDQFANETEHGLFYNIRSSKHNNLGLGLMMVHKILSEYPHSDRYLVHLTDGDYAGLEIPEGNVNRYQDIQSEQGQPMRILPGNPLVNLLLPMCNGIFVAEAGAYYGGGLHVADWQSSAENYSRFLANLVENTPEFKTRLRFVSHKDEDVEVRRAEILLETLRTWFG